MVFTHRSRMRPWHLDLTSSQNFLLFDRWSLFFFFGLMFTSSHQLTNHPLTARAPSSSENFTQSHDRSITTYCFSLFVYIQQKKTSWSSWNRSENRWRWSRACKRHCVLYDVTRCMFSPCIVLLRSGGLTGTWSRTKHFQLGRRERAHASRVLVIARSTERPSTPELPDSRSCRSSCSRSSHSLSFFRTSSSMRRLSLPRASPLFPCRSKRPFRAFLSNISLFVDLAFLIFLLRCDYCDSFFFDF